MKVITNWKTTLSASITSTQTTIPVTSIQTSDDTAHTITTDDIDSIGFMVIEPGSSKVEIIKFTGITSNGDGTGTLTGVTRGLAFYGATETAVVANGRAHQAGSTIVLTNAHYYYDDLVDIVSDETIGGIKTFSSLPSTSAGDPVDGNDLVRKAYVDTIATGTAIIAAIVLPGNAGETVVDGELLYFDDTDNEWKKCDADTAGTVENVLLGIAQGAGTDGASITGGVLIWGQDDAQTGMTAGDTMYASNTAGGISSTPGTKEVTVGIARSTTKLYFYPRFNQQLTEDQQDALAGSLGTPSSANKYLTEAGGASAAFGAQLISTAIAGLFITGQVQGDVLYKPDTPGWARLAAGSVGQFLKTQGTSANPTWAGIAFATSNVDISNSPNDGNENTVHTVNIPANTMGANGIIRIKAGITGASDQTSTVKIKFDGTIIGTIASLATGAAGEIQLDMANRNSTSSQYTIYKGWDGSTLENAAIVTSSIDTTASKNITVTLQQAGTATVVVKLNYFTVQLIKT